MSANIELTKTGNWLTFTGISKFKFDPNPIHYLEAAIVACIGKCIRDCYENQTVPIDTFQNIKVTFSNETIRIYCEVQNDKYVNAFKDIVGDCYIMESLNLDRDVTVKVL